eukprot:8401895-Alexandrium_andersonii.AAC.1
MDNDNLYVTCLPHPAAFEHPVRLSDRDRIGQVRGSARVCAGETPAVHHDGPEWQLRRGQLSSLDCVLS